jgi:hypothetical protein
MKTIGKASLLQNDLIRIVHPTAPEVITKSLVGVAISGGSIYAFEYLNGVYVQQLAVKSLVGTNIASIEEITIVSQAPLVFAIRYSSSGPKIRVWNVTTNTFSAQVALSNASLSENFGLCSSGRDGFAYWCYGKQSAFQGIYFWQLWRIDSSGTVAMITPTFEDSEIAPLDGVADTYMFWNGIKGFIPVFGASPDCGYITVEAGQTAFIQSDNFLPGDPNDWGWSNSQNYGNRIPGSNKAFGINSLDPFYSGLLNTNPPIVQNVLQANLDGRIPNYSDPSPDGSIILLTDFSEIGYIDINNVQDVVWHLIEDNPVSESMNMFCLD